MFSKLGSVSPSCGSGKVFGKHGAGAPVPRPSYFNEVVKKLRSIEHLQGLSEEDIEVRVEDLTDGEKLWAVHFSGIVLDPARENIEKNLDGVVEGEPNGRSHGAGLRIKLQCRKVRGGSQYGVQSFTSLLVKYYGPIHASILVGRAIVLEWGTCGLVIPTGKPLEPASESTPSSVSGSVASKASVATATNGGGPCLEQQPTTPEEDILHEFETTIAKKEQVDKLMAVIVKYNRNYFYHPILRNCQKFVADCLTALGRPIPRNLEGGLGNYVKEVKKGRKRKFDFESHADLDEYVGRFLESGKATLLESEYLLTQYFLFHVTSMTECGRPERWVCGMKDCQMPRLERSIDLKNTIAYRVFGST